MAHTAGEAPPGCRSTAAAAAAFGPGAPSRELPINATGQSLAAIGYRRGWCTQCPPGQRLQIRPQTDAKGGACDCAGMRAAGVACAASPSHNPTAPAMHLQQIWC